MLRVSARPLLLCALGPLFACPATESPSAASGTDAAAGTDDDDNPPALDENGSDCGDDDPLTRSDWVGFCGDRVDDNCRTDVVTDSCDDSNPLVHHPCATGDEPCPATQPASAAPTWDCTGTPPANVKAVAAFPDDFGCAFVYESTAFEGEHYVAVQGFPLVNCTYDNSARRHLYFSNLDEGDCPEIRYVHEYSWSETGEVYPTDLQKLSNHCRKMIRNTSGNDPAFNPDIQYFAASDDEAAGKLEILETAEFVCIGIDGEDGEPYRPGEVWTVFASTPLVRVTP